MQCPAPARFYFLFFKIQKRMLLRAEVDWKYQLAAPFALLPFFAFSREPRKVGMKELPAKNEKPAASSSVPLRPLRETP